MKKSLIIFFVIFSLAIIVSIAILLLKENYSRLKSSHSCSKVKNLSSLLNTIKTMVNSEKVVKDEKISNFCFTLSDDESYALNCGGDCRSLYNDSSDTLLAKAPLYYQFRLEDQILKLERFDASRYCTDATSIEIEDMEHFITKLDDMSSPNEGYDARLFRTEYIPVCFGLPGDAVLNGNIGLDLMHHTLWLKDSNNNVNNYILEGGVNSGFYIDNIGLRLPAL